MYLKSTEINDFGYSPRQQNRHSENVYNDKVHSFYIHPRCTSSLSFHVVLQSYLIIKIEITSQATGATSCRRADVKYMKDGVSVDVIESVNLSMSAKGNVLHRNFSSVISRRFSR